MVQLALLESWIVPLRDFCLAFSLEGEAAVTEATEKPQTG